MGTIILILAILVVLGVIYFLVKKDNTVNTTTPTPTTTSSPTTTVAPEPLESFWYILNRCDDSKIYFAGPFTGDKFNTGTRVEGATNVYYVVINTTNTNPESTISGITNTGLMGCA